MSAAAGSSRVVTEPLTEVSGIRSPWLTMARNSARIRSCVGCGTEIASS